MKVNEALRLWTQNEMDATLKVLNEFLESKGEPAQSFATVTPTVQFVISEPVDCSDGHTWKECLSALPPRPVLRLTAVTDKGQVVRNEKHVGDFSIEDFLKALIITGGGELTL